MGETSLAEILATDLPMLSATYLVHPSAVSFPPMPMWLGTHRRAKAGQATAHLYDSGSEPSSWAHTARLSNAAARFVLTYFASVVEDRRRLVEGKLHGTEGLLVPAGVEGFACPTCHTPVKGVGPACHRAYPLDRNQFPVHMDREMRPQPPHPKNTSLRPSFLSSLF